MPTNKLTVEGKVDPPSLLEWVKFKTGKQVELISLTSGKDTNTNKEKKEKGQSDPKEPKKPDEKNSEPEEKKKPKDPAESTVVLKIRLHCEGCINKIRKYAKKFKGVAKVEIDFPNDLVTVKGTMDTKTLVSNLEEKVNRNVEIVPQKKDGGRGENKAKGGGGGGGSENKGKGGDGENKGKGIEGKKGNKGQGGNKEGDAKENNAEENKFQHPPYNYPTNYQPSDYYQVGMFHAPQIFSDENPNACSTM